MLRVGKIVGNRLGQWLGSLVESQSEIIRNVGKLVLCVGRRLDEFADATHVTQSAAMINPSDSC